MSSTICNSEQIVVLIKSTIPPCLNLIVHNTGFTAFVMFIINLQNEHSQDKWEENTHRVHVISTRLIMNCDDLLDN